MSPASASLKAVASVKAVVAAAADEANYRPVCYSLAGAIARAMHQRRVTDTPGIVVLDQFERMRSELIRARHPERSLTDAALHELYLASLKDQPAEEQGCWVYYPWLNKLVHVLAEAEFIELRTNRNCHKITREEQQDLSQRAVGIVGLSVGYAVALCLATERACGHLRLADFDSFDLSNLNRVSTSVVNIGVNKAIACARAIAEIDPFMEVECFTRGIDELNVEAFLLAGRPLDLLVDECDSLDIKLACRVAARCHGIPVLMETSDRGLIDVERFDLEPGRPLLHGLLEGHTPEQLRQLPKERKLPLVLKMVDAARASTRGRASMLEIGSTIGTWPQLASAVALGGATATDLCRRILLGQHRNSGRYYVDLEAITASAHDSAAMQEHEGNSHPPFDPLRFARNLPIVPKADQAGPDRSTVSRLVERANLAPSTGNDQPWHWLHKGGQLHLCHDRHRSFSFADVDDIAAHISLGAALESLRLAASAQGHGTDLQLFPNPAQMDVVASVRFTQPLAQSTSDASRDRLWADALERRTTNRSANDPSPVSDADLAALQQAAASVPGARLHLVTDAAQMLALARVIGGCDRIRLLNPAGHADFAMREMRWTPAQAEAARDGIDIRTLGLNAATQGALTLIRDPEVAAHLKRIGGARMLVDAAVTTVRGASLLGVITMPDASTDSFLRGGMAMQRLWLEATVLGHALHPLISPFYLFPRIANGKAQGLDESEVKELHRLRNDFGKALTLPAGAGQVFLFKLSRGEAPPLRALRRPVDQTLTFLASGGQTPAPRP